MVEEQEIRIRAKFFDLRKRDVQNFQTNYFFTPLNNDILIFENDKAIIFLQPEDDFLHLYFATIDISALDSLLRTYDVKIDTAVEVICKYTIPQELLACLERYFVYQTTYHRTKLYEIAYFPCKTLPQYAKLNDVDFIFNCLKGEFNKYFDHFPTREELSEYVNKNQVMVKRKQGRISCYIIFTIKNRSCHFNYMQNLSSDPLLHIELINQFYNEILARGARNVYLWVDVDHNLRVKKLHEFYGHKFDGTINVTFLAVGSN